MKKVLAELHELINNLEDQGLTSEASTLQEVFVRVAQDADVKDNLESDVENLLKSHSAPEVIAELAKQMAGGDDTKTMSFAYGEEPKDVIINEFVEQAKKGDMDPNDAYFRMNQRLRFNGHDALGKTEFDDLVGPKKSQFTSEFAFGDEPESNAKKTKINLYPEQTKMVPYPKQTPEHREKVLKDFSEKMDEMDEYYKKNYPWPTAPMPYPSLSSENFYEKK